MKTNVFSRELRAELMDVDRAFKENLLPCWDDISRYVKMLDDDFTWGQFPPLVYIVYKCLGINKALSIDMTNIFKTIFLANSIHALVKDDEEGQKHNQDLQFAILIGDYMLGRMLKLLVEAEADQLVGQFASMMVEINEGRVIDRKLQADHREVLQKTHGSMYATAFATAGTLAGMSGMIWENCKQLGFNLGMAIELLNIAAAEEEAQLYIHGAERNYKTLKEHWRLENNFLEAIIDEIHLPLCRTGSLAVV